MKYYVLMVWYDTDPGLFGPFADEESRDQKAKRIRKKEGDRHGYFRMNITDDGKPEVAGYSGAFFEED